MRWRWLILVASLVWCSSVSLCVLLELWIATGIMIGLPVGFGLCIVALALEISGDPDKMRACSP
jgi:hypothetical protein